MPRINKLSHRNSINTIIPGKLYQRGQILTWQREKKYAILREYGIQTVVNFWPKLDSDLGEAGINYLHFPAVQSSQMLDSRIELASRLVSQLCEQTPVLVVCEAGKTRSVYFCILVVSLILKCPLLEAKELVTKKLRGTSLKNFMLERFRQIKTPVK